MHVSIGVLVIKHECWTSKPWGIESIAPLCKRLTRYSTKRIWMSHEWTETAINDDTLSEGKLESMTVLAHKGLEITTQNPKTELHPKDKVTTITIRTLAIRNWKIEKRELQLKIAPTTKSQTYKHKGFAARSRRRPPKKWSEAEEVIAASGAPREILCPPFARLHKVTRNYVQCMSEVSSGRAWLSCRKTSGAQAAASTHEMIKARARRDWWLPLIIIAAEAITPSIAGLQEWIDR